MRGLVELSTLRLATLAQLSPPYETVCPCVSVQAGTAPYGTIVHANGMSALAVIACAAVAVKTCPWVLPVLTLPRSEEALQPYVAFVAELRDRIGIATCSDIARWGNAAAVLRVARRRRRPGAATLSAYVAARIGVVVLIEPLREQFACALDDMPAQARSLATYSRTFARQGSFTARHWRQLAALVAEQCAAHTALADCGARAVEQRERFGGALTYRVADRYAHGFLGISFSDALSRIGWEWIVELALRRAGYMRIPTTPPSLARRRKTLALR